MKITYKTEQVKVTVEVDDARYSRKGLKREEIEAVKSFEKSFLERYVGAWTNMLQGALLMGSSMPATFDFLLDQGAQASHTLLEYTRDLIQNKRG